MKTKMLLLAALVGAAAMPANAGIRLGISLGLPLPVVVSTPVAAAPVAVVQTVPPCPGVDYVWAPGYWAYYPTGRVWVRGAWCHRPAHAGYGHYHGGRCW
jgi:hypothetical protein